jgi:hypothetical protein
MKGQQVPCGIIACVFTKVNVARCETQLLYERGKFQATYHDLTEPFGACVIGATVFEIKAGYTRGPLSLPRWGRRVDIRRLRRAGAARSKW